VLVVDDGPENRELLRLVLTEAGLVMEEAENGRLGVDAARAGRFDVILMDMQMPVMDGFTATRTLRDDGLQIPIFALTANAMKGAEKEVMAAGCTALVVKPINIDFLMETLAGVLGGTRVEDAPADAAVAKPDATESARPSAAAAESSRAPVRSRLVGNPRLLPAITKFAERLAAQLGLMERTYAAKDLTTLAELAHWLKGAAGTVGYTDFTEPAAALEDAAKTGNGHALAAMMAEIRSLAGRLEAPGGATVAKAAETPLAALPEVSSAQGSGRPAVVLVAASPAPVRSNLAGNKRLRPAIRKFAERLAGQLVLIEEAYAAKDLQALAALAHWLKGAAGTVGYNDFTEPAAALEDAAKTNNLHALGAVMGEVRSLAARLEAPAADEPATIA
jgi:CheY-like chemotaxis protein